MNYHQEILHYLPLQAMAAGFVPRIQFASKKVKTRQTVHKQRELRGNVIALDVFIGSMRQSSEASEHQATCLQDAVRERGVSLMQLASLSAERNRASQSILSLDGARRLFLLYAPSGPFAWALHWIFFFFLIAALTGLIRTLFHVAYLRPSILMPLVIGDFALAVLMRLASFYVDRPKAERQTPAPNSL
jgi:hypothetical protein